MMSNRDSYVISNGVHATLAADRAAFLTALDHVETVGRQDPLAGLVHALELLQSLNLELLKSAVPGLLTPPDIDNNNHVADTINILTPRQRDRRISMLKALESAITKTGESLVKATRMQDRSNR